MPVPWITSGLLLQLLLVLMVHAAHTAPDLSLYLYTILKNHTAHACEGDTLTIECPPRTSVTILSAFYGRRVPHQYLCPSLKSNATAGEDAECSSPVAIEKVLAECQYRQACHIPVFIPVFGLDPCPLTTKYLLVSYKCRPEHHLTRLVCENERLRLACKNETVLTIYSAVFGHLLHGSPSCPQEPGSRVDMECLSPSALRKVSRRCHGRANCTVLADTLTFGDPCFPGTRKHLRVSFTCVPRYLLEDVGRGSVDPFLISDYTHGEVKPENSRFGSFWWKCELRRLSPAGGWYTGPPYRPQNVLFTNFMEMIEKILGLPERVALYFVSGICAGLVFLLCLFGLRSTLVKDVKELVSELKASQREQKEFMDDLFEDDISDSSSFCRLTQSHCTTDAFTPSTLTVEMVQREVEQMRNVFNGDIWPHHDSNPYSIHKIKTYDN